MAKMIKCPFCGGLADASSDDCIHCGGPLKNRAVPAADTGTSSSSHCPACGAAVGSGDIVCVKCGTNLLTGQKIEQQDKQDDKKVRANFNRIFGYAVLGVLVLLILAGLAFFAFFMLQDPVGEARRVAASGDYGDAIELLQSHIHNAPKDEEAQFLLGVICWNANQFGRASETFEAVARQHGARERDALILAVLAAERDQKTTDRARLSALLELAVQERYSGDAELLKLLALLRGVEEEYKEFRERVRLAQIMGAPVAPSLPGLSMLLDDAPDAAVSELDKVLADHPENTRATVVRAVASLMRDEEAQALPLLESVTELPDDLAGLVKLNAGLLEMKQGENGKALSLLTDAKKLLPDDVRASFFHALCLQENKLLDEALAALEPISNGKSEFAGAAALQMAIAYMDKDVLDRAAAMARQASESGLNTARQATIQGRIFALQHDTNQAEQAYRRAISMHADYPAARLELGLLLINRGSTEAGLQELEYYLDLAKEDPQKLRLNEIEVLVSQIRQSRQ